MAACVLQATFEDDDAPGRALAEHVSVQIHPVADSVRRIAFVNEREKFDITNWVKAHDPEQLIADGTEYEKWGQPPL